SLPYNIYTLYLHDALPIFIEDIEEGYHTYKTVWTENDIQYFIDGEHVYTFTPPEYNDAHYPFRHPFYFLINMAVGGNFGGPEVRSEEHTSELQSRENIVCC